MRARLDQVTGTDRLVLYSPAGAPAEYVVLARYSEGGRIGFRIRQDGQDRYLAGPPDLAVTLARTPEGTK